MLKKNDKIINSAIIKFENQRKKYFNNIPRGIYVLNPLASCVNPMSFEPINKKQQKYLIRFNSNTFSKGGKKVNNLIKLAFIQAKLWMSNLDYTSKDAILNEIKKNKIAGFKNKIQPKYRLYCPRCLKNGRYNYIKTTKLKPRQMFCPYCDEYILFKAKKCNI